MIKHTIKMASMFGSTSAYEQLVSSMKPSKSKVRTQLIYEHLQNVLLLAPSNLPPELQQILNKKTTKYHTNVVL